ncbi:MAG: pyridoxal-phosphate dependent enzyme [Armatimonadetes bacterium]|nr:pyridoxal-phosphate dependent enzyme [Armatimonadota bacterium]
MELAPAAILPGEILHKILINVLRVVSVHGMPGRSLLEDPRGVLVMLGAFSALLAVLRVPGPRRLPLGPCVVCLGAIVFSLYLVGRAYPGRFSIHLIPAATALAVCTLSLVFNDLKTWIGMAVPCYNDEQVLGQLVGRLKPVLDSSSFPWEILLVNDGSRDETWRTILELGQREERVRGIDLSRNFGHQIAVTAGLDFCEGDCAVVMDSDLQDPPELIPELLKKWQEGFEIVYAVHEERQDSFLKRLGAGAFYWLLKKLSGTPLPHQAGDFRLMGRPVVEALRRIRERHRYIRGLTFWTGFKTASVSYTRTQSLRGGSGYTFKKLVRLGMDAIVVLNGEEPTAYQGNLLLDRILGAEIRVVQTDDDYVLMGVVDDLARQLRRDGRKPYVIPRGGGNAVGAAAYVEAALELLSQANAAGLRVDAIVHASTSGGTQSGLYTGTKLTQSGAQVIGISAGPRREVVVTRVLGIVEELAAMLSLEWRPHPDDLIVYDDYVGERYGMPTKECLDAIRIVARTEGILLDPVYTGKGMAGLMGLIAQERLRSDQNVVFWHTGGQPAVFAYAAALQEG